MGTNRGGVMGGRRGRYRRMALVAVLLGSLAACDVWEQQGQGPGNGRSNPAATGITPGNAGSLSGAWSTPVAGRYSEPVLSGNRLYTTVAPVGSGSGPGGSVRSYDVATGALVWSRALPAPAVPGA